VQTISNVEKCNFWGADSGYMGAINNKFKFLALAKDPQRFSKGKKCHKIFSKNFLSMTR
jgi:hypothetical protein